MVDCRLSHWSCSKPEYKAYFNVFHHLFEIEGPVGVVSKSGISVEDCPCYILKDHVCRRGLELVVLGKSSSVRRGFVPWRRL